jgi:hypothetical protein
MELANLNRKQEGVELTSFNATQNANEFHIANKYRSGLPDGIFSNQKSQFW